MKVNGKIVIAMAKEYTFLWVEADMKDHGKIIIGMVKEHIITYQEKRSLILLILERMVNFILSTVEFILQ